METQILKYWTDYQDDNYSKTVVNELNIERNDTIIQILKKFCSPAITIAEIGTGSGQLLHDLKKMWGEGCVVCGFDLPKVITECKKRYPEIEFYEFDAEKDRLSTVNVIIASEVIEHLADDFGFLQRCRLATRHIILSVPSSNFIGENDHHLRTYSRYSMQKLLTIAGFLTVHYQEAAGSQYFYARAMETKI